MLSKANIQFKLDEFGMFSPDENLWLPGDKNFADLMGSNTPKVNFLQIILTYVTRVL